MPDERLTVLVAAAEDDALSAIAEAFPHDLFAPLATRSWAQIEASLGERVLAAAIVHHKLLDIGCLEFCLRLRTLPDRGDLPIIVLVPGVGRAPDPGEPFDVAMRFPSGPGVLTDNLAKVISRTDATLKQAEEDLRSEIRKHMSGIDKKTYFEILGVARDASRDGVIKAYDEFSLRLHPDRLARLKQDSNVAAQAAEFYMLVTEAYQTLLEPTKRRRYLAGLSAGKLRFDPSMYQTISDPGGITQVDNAKRYLRLAQKELDRGDSKAAVVFLKMAKAVDPTNQEIARRLHKALSES